MARKEDTSKMAGRTAGAMARTMDVAGFGGASPAKPRSRKKSVTKSDKRVERKRKVK